jgi:hypothetical protein
MNRRPLFRLAWFTLLILLPVVGRGGDIVSEVPHDALGFVVVHDLSSVDAKIGQLAALLQRNVPRPLAFLKEFAGIGEGLQTGGDLMLALFPAARGSESPLQFCVWLPVADYDRFLGSLGATSIDGVAAVTLAGEDLLVARHGNWALVMDPDQRERIAQLASASPAQPNMPAWNDWIAGNDVTIVIFASGVRSFLSWTGNERAIGKAGTANSAENNFRVPDPNDNRRAIVAGRPARTLADWLERATIEYRKWLAAAPELTDTIQHANILGCGIRLDASGNAITSMRIGLSNNSAAQPIGAKDAKDGGASELPFALSENGEFVLSGAGHLPPRVLAAYAKGQARRQAADLKAEERTELDDSALKRLLAAVEQASADVRSFVVLSQPGKEPQPVYSNNFVAVRVESASTFVDHAREVMRLWNSANREAKGETQLVFDVEETKLGDRAATLYSLDVADLVGGLVLPDDRRTMEKFFGAGGKLRLWIVPADDTTVLLAMATPDQMTTILKALDRKQKLDWNRGDLSDVSALLPAQSDWRFFVDPDRYVDWLRRETAAVVGVPVIGGPLVKEFPASPPIGLAGGFRANELWLNVAALAPTVKAADLYLTRSRSRSLVPLRARVVPAAPAPAPAPKPN